MPSERRTPAPREGQSASHPTHGRPTASSTRSPTDNPTIWLTRVTDHVDARRLHRPARRSPDPQQSEARSESRIAGTVAAYHHPQGARYAPGMSPRIIVTGDDFGRSAAVNEAVACAHRDGILTAASLMVAGPAVDEALALARSTPTLAVGLHLVLCDGAAAAPPRVIPRLAGADGRLPDGPALAGLRYYADRRLRRELTREIQAQFEAFRGTGLALDHVDGHHHLHLHPTVLPTVVACARRYGAKGIRVTKDDLWLAWRSGGGGPVSMAPQQLTFTLLARHARARTQGLATTERVYGLLRTGCLDEGYLIRLLSAARCDVAELYTHPGAPEGDDLPALLDPRVRAIIDRGHVELTTYTELAVRSATPAGT